MSISKSIFTKSSIYSTKHYTHSRSICTITEHVKSLASGSQLLEESSTSKGTNERFVKIVQQPVCKAARPCTKAYLLTIQLTASIAAPERKWARTWPNNRKGIRNGGEMGHRRAASGRVIRVPVVVMFAITRAKYRRIPVVRVPSMRERALLVGNKIPIKHITIKNIDWGFMVSCAYACTLLLPSCTAMCEYGRRPRGHRH